MNRGVNGDSTESASGGLYRKDARVICGNKLGVNYLCGEERPDRRTRTKREVRWTNAQDQGDKQGDELKSERHSSNRRNWNRIRKKLAKEIRCNRAREDITAEEKESEDKRLLKLLETYQRPQREPRPPANGSRGGRGKKKPAITNKDQAVRWSGAIHSACVIHHKTVVRKARGRRYGVVSNRRKFHGQVKRKSRTWRKS